MKTKNGFNLRTVCGEHIIVAEGLENIDFSRIINLNESAAFLWKNVQGKSFNVRTLTDLLLNEYEVDQETAQDHVEQLIDAWEKAGIIEKEDTDL